MKMNPKAYLDRLKTMSGEERFKIAADLSETVRQIAKTAIENEHPEWSPFQVRQELLKRLHGSNICSQIGRSRTK